MADEISPYWRVVIETNREGLRSGDPDLIYPGETVVLPPVNESR
jgi:nucleoid-associated protein YgaU